MTARLAANIRLAGAGVKIILFSRIQVMSVPQAFLGQDAIIRMQVIPPHIRDRFRIVKVPLPGLQHLRPLAQDIMADLAAEADVDVRWMAPLDADEEAVIAKVWARVGFSIRKLQKIVSATLEARDAQAMRQ